MDDETLERAAKLLKTLASTTETLGKNQLFLRKVEQEAREIAKKIEIELGNKNE